MTTFVMLLVTAAFARGPVTSKIVGGAEARTGEFPAIVALSHDDGEKFCGGTLIRPNWVLTAAHCVQDGDIHVTTGLNSADGVVEHFEVEEVIAHPEYDKPIQTAHDFALLKLDGRSKATPLDINKMSLQVPDDESASPVAVTAGWGSMAESGPGHVYPDQLYRVDVNLVSDKRCQLAYPGRIDPTMMCAGFEAGGHDSCDGDSGGPLILKTGTTETLIGVVSWGDGCARAHAFGVYSRVDAAASWIAQTLTRH